MVIKQPGDFIGNMLKMNNDGIENSMLYVFFTPAYVCFLPRACSRFIQGGDTDMIDEQELRALC